MVQHDFSVLQWSATATDTASTYAQATQLCHSDDWLSREKIDGRRKFVAVVVIRRL